MLLYNLGRPFPGHLPGGSQEKQPLEFSLNSTQPQPLKNVHFPDNPGFWNLLRVASLPHFSAVSHMPHELPGALDTPGPQDKCSPTKPAAPPPNPNCRAGENLGAVREFPWLHFLPVNSRHAALSPQALSQLEESPSLPKRTME